MAKSSKVPTISVSSVRNINPWDFIWWVLDNVLLLRRKDPAKIWLCLVNDNDGMVFIRINTNEYDPNFCFLLDDHYQQKYEKGGGYVACSGDPIEIPEDKMSEIQHAHQKPSFFRGKILPQHQVEIRKRIENSIWMPREIKDRIS